MEQKKTNAVKFERKQVAEKVVGQAKSRATISLGDLFGKMTEEKESRPQVAATPSKVQQKPTVKAPRGVPAVSRWSQNPDGSINGRIAGSPNFNDGDAITTSPVAQGATSNSVVTTSSGSK
jgi:hypothetical protein